MNDKAMNDRAMNREAVVYASHAGVATITLNQPDSSNVFSAELVNDLGDALDHANNDNAVRAIVLTNEGKTFCAGADLKADKPGVAANTDRTFVDIFKMIMTGPKPVLGQINGHALGGGVGLAAACDISVMRDDAKIGFTEVRLGVAPAVISVVCLPKMRRSDAMELFLTGERFSPARAAEVGLISRAVPAETLPAEIERYVNLILKGGPIALGAAKELVNKVVDLDTGTAFDWTTKRSIELFDSPEAKAGIAAFRAREPAPWTKADPASRAAKPQS